MTNLPVCQGAKPSVPWVMTPTRVGTRMPGMVASMLVMAIRVPEMGVSAFLIFLLVPAKLGVRSAWLENTPENMLKIQVDLNKEMETSSTDIF